MNRSIAAGLSSQKAPRLGLYLVAAIASSALGAAAVVAPHQLGIWAALVTVGALVVYMPPHRVLAAAILVIGISQGSGALMRVGEINVLAGDALVALILLRACIPKARAPRARPLRGIPSVLIAAWLTVMMIAATRGYLMNSSLDTVFRLAMPAIYFVFIYYGVSAICQERDFSLWSFVREAAVVIVALVGWMLLMRALGTSFERTNELGIVEVGGGEVLHRDYGFLGAFVLYPVLGLVGMAILVYGQRHSAWVTFATVVGIAATLMTLVRGQIFGLAIAAVLLLFAGSRWSGGMQTPQRMQAAIQLGLGAVCVVLALAFWNPALLGGIVERSLPGIIPQPERATKTAEPRLEALQLGIKVAEREPAGLGLVPLERLTQESIPVLYAGHSTPAWLLYYLGWPGLFTALAVWVALGWRSFRTSSSHPWVHPAFIAVMIMMTVYCLTASALVQQSWVIALMALVIAVRFGVPAHDHNEKEVVR